MTNRERAMNILHHKEDIKNEVQKVFDTCSQYENFMISTGCDVPADSKWENLNAYFEKVKELYA